MDQGFRISAFNKLNQLIESKEFQWDAVTWNELCDCNKFRNEEVPTLFQLVSRLELKVFRSRGNYEEKLEELCNKIESTIFIYF